MPLEAGTQLGPYEILSPLGAGGMGEVYKARDTRLDRTVAIKVLLAHVADDPDLRQRFEREAKTISSLNHPHICTLHDIGQQDGIDYLVMEYLEGETLAQRLEKGALPLDRALQYAIEIADALDKAHRKGITHRDLKPGNIMITKAGTKLLDFGLAKLREPKAAVISPSERETRRASLTGEGTILGTLQYMAPEQLEGKDADARTDIFAFGSIVYEMITGKEAFTGESQASLIAAILDSQPTPMSTLQRCPAHGSQLLQISCSIIGTGSRDLVGVWLEGADWVIYSNRHLSLRGPNDKSGICLPGGAPDNGLNGASGLRLARISRRRAAGCLDRDWDLREVSRRWTDRALAHTDQFGV